jgi:hypothetical protein
VSNNPTLLILIGFVLVVFGFVVPFLMTLRVIESTFFLNFASYTASFLGLVFGIVGAAMIYRGRRDRD